MKKFLMYESKIMSLLIFNYLYSKWFNFTHIIAELLNSIQICTILNDLNF